MKFILPPQLAADCLQVGQLRLSRILLMNDRQFPWYILVPERQDVTEIYRLSQNDQMQLWRESALLAEMITQIHQPDTLNIATIGNIVPQLHMHHIARYKTDKAWPAPVWGKFDRLPYGKDTGEQQVSAMRDALEGFLLD